MQASSSSLACSADLLCGTGDWTNMQEVVRKSFQTCFEHMNQQQQLISQLQSEMTSLRTQLAAKPARPEAIELVHATLAAALSTNATGGSKKTSASRTMTNGVFGDSSDSNFAQRQAVADLVAQMQQRATIQYVDNALRMKADRSEILPYRLKLRSDSEVLPKPTEVAELATRLVTVESAVKELQPSKVQALAFDIKCLSEDISDLRQQLSDRPTSFTMNQLLASKANSSLTKDIDELRADVEQVTEKVDRVEQSATKARIKSNRLQPNRIFSNSQSKENRQHLGINDTEQYHKQQPLHPDEDSHALDLLLEESNGDAEGLHELLHRLQAGQKHAIERDRSHNRRLLKLEDALVYQSSSREQLDMFAVVLEEQRLRLDAILSGSTPIPSVVDELRQHRTRLQDIDSYLVLPQSCSLPEQQRRLEAVTATVDQKLHELSSEVRRLGSKISVVEKSQGVVDLRLHVLESKQREKAVQHHQQPSGAAVEPSSSSSSGSALASTQQVTEQLLQLSAQVTKLRQRSPKEWNSHRSRLDEHEVRLVSVEERCRAVESDTRRASAEMQSLQRTVVEGLVGLAAATTTASSSSSSFPNEENVDPRGIQRVNRAGYTGDLRGGSREHKAYAGSRAIS